MKAKIIALSGVDGCGKTSVINELRKALSGQGRESRHVWLRYNHYLTKFLLALCRFLGFTKYENIDGVRIGYHEFYRSKIISYLFILLTYLDTFIATLVTIYIPAVFSHKVIICDRWIFDIMVDLEVDTGIGFIQENFLSKVFKRMIPKGARCFLIQRDQLELIKARKESVLDKNFLKRLELYQRHSIDPLICVVNNSRSIRDAVNQIMVAWQ